jgi:hypothetical protein
MRRLVRAFAVALVVASVAACASVGTGPGNGGAPAPVPDQLPPRPGEVWPMKVREHVDLWLHGFAMLQEDTTFVPFFKRGYGTEMTVLKNRSNVVTQLDANHDKLRAHLAANAQLINAQFVPFAFSSWDELAQTVDMFVRANGNPRAASSQQQATAIAFLAAYFQTGPDRDWLRLFVQSLNDELNRFYHSFWLQRQHERANVLELADTLWQHTYRPRFQPFLNNTQQAQGDVLLSLPLDGEGRTQTNGARSNTMAVTFPERPNDAVEAIYVIAHEVVGQLAATAVSDNITPEQRRTGLGDRYQSAASVRGGALLIQRVSPDILDGYMRYYLRSVNRPVGANVQTTFTSVFSIPDTIRDAMNRQMDVVLGGI